MSLKCIGHFGFLKVLPRASPLWLRVSQLFNLIFNMPLVISCRKLGLRSSMSVSERTKVMKMKAQMERQIQALAEQINLENFALTASNRPDRKLVKTLR